MTTVHSVIKLNIVLFCIIYSNPFYCQNKEVLFSTSFDKAIGAQNLEIFNGAIHINNDRTITGKHRYFENEAYSIGNITYNNQVYNNLNLKYDIYDDRLVLNLDEDSNYSGINLISENTTNFVIKNKTFVNSDQLLNFPATYKKGYYQEIKFSKNFTLYIKHFKTRREVINEKSILVDFKSHNDFVLLKDATFYTVDSKKEISKIFVKSKNKIDSYFDEKKAVEKENKVLFIIELMKTLSLE